jgi:hypothetical protein
VIGDLEEVAVAELRGKGAGDGEDRAVGALEERGGVPQLQAASMQPAEAAGEAEGESGAAPRRDLLDLPRQLSDQPPLATGVGRKHPREDAAHRLLSRDETAEGQVELGLETRQGEELPRLVPGDLQGAEEVRLEFGQLSQPAGQGEENPEDLQLPRRLAAALPVAASSAASPVRMRRGVTAAGWSRASSRIGDTASALPESRR